MNVRQNHVLSALFAVAAASCLSIWYVMLFTVLPAGVSALKSATSFLHYAFIESGLNWHFVFLAVIGPIVIGVLSGCLVLQYADVRAAYPAALTGRAMAVFTMSMFLGVAAMQWLTGVIASAATAAGIEPFTAVLASMAGLLAMGVLGFVLLPAPPKAATCR